MAIKILITLEGSEQVKGAIDELINKGQELGSSLANVGKESKSPFQDFQVNLENAKPAFDNAREATQGFREAVHILHPILRAAGLEVGNLGGFARVASAGMIGLTTAITGAVVVGLATLEEQAQKTRSQLAGLFGSKELGAEVFKGIEQSAESLGTTVNSLAPIFQSATTALQRFVQSTQGFKFVALRGIDLPPGLVGNIKNTTEAITNLVKIIRAGGQDESEAEKSAKAFFDTMKEGGKLTAEALKQMDQFPGAVQLLADALGRGTITSEQFIAEVSQAPIPINKVLEALAKFGPGAQQAFDATGIKSWKDEMQSALNALQKGFKDLTGLSFSEALAAAFREIAKQIKQAKDDLNNFIGIVKTLDTVHMQLPGMEDTNKTLANSVLLMNQVSDAFNQGLGGAFGGTAADIKKIWEGIAPPTDLGSKFVTLGGQINASFKEVPQIKTAIDSVTPEMKALQDQASATFDATRRAEENLASEFDKGFSELIAKAKETREIGPGFVEAWTTALGPAFDAIVSEVGQRREEIKTAATQPPPDLSPWASAFQNSFNDVVALAQSAYQQIQSIFSQPITLTVQTQSESSPFGFMFARGGYVRGPGTSTSDSIPALLSDREYVVNARAVSFYGTNLLHALNSLKLPRSLFEGFSMGGLVDAMARSIPRFADGGQVDSSIALAPVTIVLGSQKFGLAANADTIKALSRFAVNSRLSSGGRKPSWVGSK